MRRRIIVVGPRAAALAARLGDYAPANTTPQPNYSGREAEGYAQQHPAVVPPSSQPPVKAPPTSGAVYVPQQPWVTPPPDAESIDPQAWIVMPAAAPTVQVPVLQFTVPTGRDGVITKWGNMVFGAGWTEGSGQLIWRILRNGEAVRNYENILASLGNFSNPVDLGLRIYEGDLIQVTIENTVIVPGGQRVGARMHGWFYPKAHDTQGWA